MDAALLEFGLTILGCGMTLGVGAVSIAVLPWTDREVNASATAFSTIPAALRSASLGVRNAIACPGMRLVPGRQPATVPARAS